MATVLDAIYILGEVNDGKSDKETHKLVERTIKAIEFEKARWPSFKLKKIVSEMSDSNLVLFLSVLKDMKQVLDEHYGELR